MPDIHMTNGYAARSTNCLPALRLRNHGAGRRRDDVCDAELHLVGIILPRGDVPNLSAKSRKLRRLVLERKRVVVAKKPGTRLPMKFPSESEETR